MVTRLALYCVCDHEHFMSLDSDLFSNNILEVSENFCLGDSRTCFANNCINEVFLVLVVWRLFWFSLNSKVDMRALSLFTVIAQRVSHAGSTYECIGSSCDLRWSSIE